jgi:NADH-quinone oxidoreductase subunit L
VDTSLLAWLVIALPFIGFLINAFAGAGITGGTKPSADAHDHGHGHGHDDHGHGHAMVKGATTVGGIATAVMLAAFVCAALIFLQVSGIQGEERRVLVPGFAWIPGIGLNFGLNIDPLSTLMMLIITGIGTLIHLYSIGYMGSDKGVARYFTYLNLFVFFMLLLVMGSNLIVLFVGWEGVGLASYLLIGFYDEKTSATTAGKKAFIVNRIGDCALLIALFMLYKFFGTFDLYGTNGILTQTGMAGAEANGYLTTVGNIVPLLLFLGAAGKSAQIPLYVWLPDAMEGPTPVSALIHAATMVTGGVYLVCRMHPLFLLSESTMTVVAVIGVTTAFLAATIALAQTDIKKVLAYSTVSQLGYMFLACGVGAFGAAMFHVTTHAFFKALLFLGSGSVIHAMNGEQDMRRMGALKNKIKTTYAVMWIGTIAIAGIPPLAGFFSKDEILANAFAGPAQKGLGHPALFGAGWIVAGLTAFYMTRMMMKTFHGEARYDAETAKHIHESPALMTVPLMILAGLSIVGGFMGGFAPLHIKSTFEHFLGSTVEWRNEANALKIDTGTEWGLVAASVLIAILGVGYAWSVYSKLKDGEKVPADKKKPGSLWYLLHNKWDVDEIYDESIVEPGHRFARNLWRTVDLRIVDGVVNGIAGSINGFGNYLKEWQSGYVRNYALSMLIGVLVVIVGCIIGLRIGMQ